MKIKIESVVIKKDVCATSGILNISPQFFEPVGCYGCSIFHVCRISRGYNEVDAQALNEHINNALGLE